MFFSGNKSYFVVLDSFVSITVRWISSAFVWTSRFLNYLLDGVHSGIYRFVKRMYSIISESLLIGAREFSNIRRWCDVWRLVYLRNDFYRMRVKCETNDLVRFAKTTRKSVGLVLIRKCKFFYGFVAPTIKFDGKSWRERYVYYCGSWYM